jgi:hypothetical protein
MKQATDRNRDRFRCRFAQMNVDVATQAVAGDAAAINADFERGL